MFRPVRRAALATLAIAATLAAGCSSTTSANEQPGDDAVSIVAITNVWADIAAQVAGPDAAVTALIDDPSQDPHDYQASGRDELAVSRADIVIVNGGGYDDFLGAMIAALPSAPTVINVFDLAEAAGLVTDDNEHLWFSLPAVRLVADTLAERLAAIDPSEIYDASALQAALADLASDIDRLRAARAGTPILVTEPLPHYLVEAADLDDITPAAFTEALEDGVDVSPTELAAVLDLIPAARLVIHNIESGSNQAQQLVGEARAAGLPVVTVTELLPPDTHYQQWVGGVIADISRALDAAPEGATE